MLSSLVAPLQVLLHSGRASHEPAMDEFVRQSISIVEMRKKGTVPWQVDEPFDQPYHRWIDGGWHAIKAGTDDTAGKKGICSKLALYSWNIDFMTPYSDSRMRVRTSWADWTTTC